MKPAKPKVVVVMPAYNAAKTLRTTYRELPHDVVDLVILVDDGSSDETAEIARELGLELFVHNRNYGYGANQKTCYREALKAGADIIVMVHLDYQYDPTLLPEGIRPIQQGMPWWKYITNRFLIRLENAAFGLHLSEYHTGYRAYSRPVLEAVNPGINSDGFIFDQKILAQIVALKMQIREVSVPTRCFPAASSASFFQSVIYGLSILALVGRYLLHCGGLRQRQFDSLQRRYRGTETPEQETQAGPLV